MDPAYFTQAPPAIAGFSLEKRFAWASAARLLLLTILLGIISFVNAGETFTATGYTAQVALVTLGVAFGLSAVYVWFLRQGRHLLFLVNVQLVLDQMIWTVVVYLSGGATSGATSFYGLSCLFGAVLAGFRGAALAAAAAAVSYIALVSSLANGWLHAPPDQPASAYINSTEELIYSGVVNLLVLAVVALLAGNLTERLRATGGRLVRVEARLDQAEREAELGRLAAALAHEIRNPLGAISGSIRLLKTTPSLGQEDRLLCDIVDREAERLNNLVSDMLNLAKRRVPELSVVNIAAIAAEVTSLARNSGRSVSDVRVSYEGPELLSVMADGEMVRQMLWNLVRNAVQASPSGGHVQVTGERMERHAAITVADSGEGLTDKAKTQIFDAFFTTRSQGTGIGLAVVKRIVDDHQFSISVRDTDGGGATFRVELGTLVSEPVGTPQAQAKERWTLFPRAR